MQAEPSASGDEKVAVVEGIGELGQAVIAAWGGHIELGRTLHGERLVRAFGIELAHEGIEAGLLLQAVAAGRAGFLLQGQVHALVAAILLRMAWLDARLKTEPMTAVQARARHREWLSDIEARIANIRAT